MLLNFEVTVSDSVLSVAVFSFQLPRRHVEVSLSDISGIYLASLAYSYVSICEVTALVMTLW